MAQLIHDLGNANPKARISVKPVPLPVWALWPQGWSKLAATTRLSLAIAAAPEPHR